MNYKPLGEQVLLELHKFEKKVGGIIIPESAEQAKWYGTIKAFGSECKTDLKVGDSVLYSIYGAKEIEKDELITVPIGDLLCIVEF